ncbi:MAG TPA: hypothetical protein VMU38_10960 [Candidatus Binatia bacterium]|nr:hypothetical protein [Candidatus Binatia bacterium]
MTGAEIASNSPAALSLLVAVASVVIAALALRRTGRAEQREREAIIVIRNVWSGTPGGAESIIVSNDHGVLAAQLIQRKAPPPVAEQQLVIAMESRDPGVLVRQSDDVVLELRSATPRDLADHDGPGGRNTHYIVLELRNVGRWAATNVQIDCTLEGTFLEEFGEGTIERSFHEQLIGFEALAADEARYIRLRNMTGLPVTLEFNGASAGNDQPIRLAPASPAAFQPRGYRS